MSALPLRVVRPVVVPAQFFVWGIVIPAVIALGISLFVGNIVDRDRAFTRKWNQSAPADWRESEPGTFPWGVAVFFAVFAVGAGVATVKLVVEPRYTEYKVFPDRAEYSEGFFNRSQRTVVFDQVIDVRLE